MGGLFARIDAITAPTFLTTASSRSRVTIAALCQQASQAAVRREQADSYTYQI